jgi:hypothetical protein
LTLIERINNYIREFGDILTTDGNKLFCRACNREISRAFKKYSVTQHFNTHSHIQAFKRFVDCDQQSIVCDQINIKTEPKDCFVENFENTIVLEEVNDKNMSQTYSHFDKSPINDFKTNENSVSIFDKIKDKVKLLLNDCKCEHNSSLKYEVKQLINEYELNYDLNNYRVNSLNENCAKIKANQQLNSSAIDMKKGFIYGIKETIKITYLLSIN